MTDKEKIIAYIDKLLEKYPKNYYLLTVAEFIDSLQEEPVSQDLIDATNNYCVNVRKGYPRVKDETDRYICNAFEAGAKWQKKHLWKPADGKDLPEIDREVIVLLNNGRVTFGHRPPEYWDGKDIITEKVTRNYIERYDKGLWNLPNIKYWLDCDLPKIKEE